MSKKRKKNKHLKKADAFQYGIMQAMSQNGGNGLLNGLSRLLPSGRTEQFLLGAAIGAAAAYVLSNEELRGKLLRAGVDLYTNLAGGLAEIKEQMADIQAEKELGQNSLS